MQDAKKGEKMKVRMELVIGALIVLAGFPTVSGYHIDGSAAGTCANGAVSLAATTSDWCIGGAGLIVCETEGSSDDRNTNAASLPGTGGLCTTGRNDATGNGTAVRKPGNNPTTVTRIDVCQLTIGQRGGPEGGCNLIGGLADPCDRAETAANSFADRPGDCTDGVQFTLEVGAFGCTIPTQSSRYTDGAGGQQQHEQDYAGYYDEGYAWWSYDGDGSYTAGDAAGVAMTGDGNLQDNDPEPTTPGQGSDNVDGFHGHAAVFISTSNPSGALRQNVGSVATWSFTNWATARDYSEDQYDHNNPVQRLSNAAAAGWADGNMWLGGGWVTKSPQGGLYNNCGGSPSDGATTTNIDAEVAGTGPGPVVRGW